MFCFELLHLTTLRATDGLSKPLAAIHLFVKHSCELHGYCTKPFKEFCSGQDKLNQFANPTK